MAENKKTFIFYSDWINMIKEMPDKDAGQLLKHILSYVNDEEPTTDNILVKMAFGHMKPMLKSDLEKWEKQLTKFSEMGKASAKKRAELKVEPTLTYVEPTSTVNDNVNVNVNVNDNVNENKEKPSLSEKSDGTHKLLIEIFGLFYLQKKGVEYSFGGAKDGTAMKFLISKIKKQWKVKHKTEASQKDVRESFNWMLNNIEKSEWVYNNLSIAILSSKFNEIIQHIKSENNGNRKKAGIAGINIDKTTDFYKNL